jgi:pimeloyl-ACP methyl ester carboxylesterase
MHSASVQASSVFVSAPDGLRLHVRCYEPRAAVGLPVICLPGLARTTADFDVLAAALAAESDHPRRVFALDYRGRGQSDYDSNPDNYSVAVELADLIAVLTALNLEPAIFIGTSRGGILAMLLAAVRPGAIAGVVLNDIGPAIEAKGLMRIKDYVGKLPQPKDFADAAEIQRGLFGAQFPKLTADDWLASARRSFKDENGRLVPTYDINLAKTLTAVAADRPIPELWPQFDALACVPVMVIRGMLSDILTKQTVEAMRARHPEIEIAEVPDEGHAPLLADKPTIARIREFLTKSQRAEAHRI